MAVSGWRVVKGEAVCAWTGNNSATQIAVAAMFLAVRAQGNCNGQTLVAFKVRQFTDSHASGPIHSIASWRRV